MYIDLLWKFIITILGLSSYRMRYIFDKLKKSYEIKLFAAHLKADIDE